MKQATREWIKKAEGDYAAATILSRRRKVPLHDHVCFHCQQSAEKYLKAFSLLAQSPNQKVLMLPIEAMNVLGSLAGIGEIAKATFGEAAASAAARRTGSVPNTSPPPVAPQR